MKDQDALLSVIGRIYDTLLEDAPEQGWLDGLRDWIGAGHACLNEVGASTRWWSCSRFSVDDRALGDRFVREPDYALALEQAPVMQPVRLSAFVPVDDLRRTDMYQELIRPMQGGLAAVCAWRRDRDLHALTLCRSAEDDDDFSDEEVAALRPLLSHLRNAVRLRARLLALETALSQVHAALDAVQDGVLVLDAAGRVRHANVSARRLLAEGDGLRLEYGRLRAARGEDDRPLQALLQATLALRGALHGRRGAADPSLLPGTGDALLLERVRPRRPLRIAVVPSLGGARLLDGDAREAAIALVRGPDRAGACTTASLMALFGLTRREAELARALGDGNSLSAAAVSLGITEGTARQYLKGVFVKVGVDRQPALVGLLSALA